MLVALVGTERFAGGTFLSIYGVASVHKLRYDVASVNKLRFAVALVGTLVLFAGGNVGRKAVGFLLFIVFDGS